MKSESRGRKPVKQSTKSFTVSITPDQKKDIEAEYGSLTNAVKSIASKPFYAHYTEWEDFKNGMYDNEVKIHQIENSRLLLCDTEKLSIAMLLVIDTWVVSSKQNMTKKGVNKQSWLGQAACSITHGSTEFETRMAWGEMTENQRGAANLIADEIIIIYEAKNT